MSMIRKLVLILLLGAPLGGGGGSMSLDYRAGFRAGLEQGLAQGDELCCLLRQPLPCNAEAR